MEHSNNVYNTILSKQQNARMLLRIYSLTLISLYIYIFSLSLFQCIFSLSLSLERETEGNIEGERERKKERERGRGRRKEMKCTRSIGYHRKQMNWMNSVQILVIAICIHFTLMPMGKTCIFFFPPFMAI